MFGPTSYHLTKRRVEDRNALEDEIAAMTGGGSSRDRDRDRNRDRADARRDTSRGSLVDCKKLGIGSNTGDVICKD